MSALINLVPDTQSQKLKEKRVNAAFVLATTLVVVIAVGINVGLLAYISIESVRYEQAKNRAQEIRKELADGGYNKLEREVATYQQHLDSLSGLLSTQPILSSFFEHFTKTQPPGLTVSKLDVKPGNQLQLTGTAQSVTQAAKFAEGLRLYGATYNQEKAKGTYFKDVILSTVNKQGSEIGYIITLFVDSSVAEKQQ